MYSSLSLSSFVQTNLAIVNFLIDANCILCIDFGSPVRFLTCFLIWTNDRNLNYQAITTEIFSYVLDKILEIDHCVVFSDVFSQKKLYVSPDP